MVSPSRNRAAKPTAPGTTSASAGHTMVRRNTAKPTTSSGRIAQTANSGLLKVDTAETAPRAISRIERRAVVQRHTHPTQATAATTVAA